jgi:competence protein ComEC
VSLAGVNAVMLTDQRHAANHFSNTKHFSEEAYNTFTVQVRKVLTSNNRFNRFEIEVNAFNGSPVKGRALMYIDRSDSLELFEPFTQWAIYGRMGTTKPTANPSSFNYKDYLSRRQIYHQIYLRPGDIHPVSPDEGSLAYRVHLARDKIRNALISAGYSREQQAFMGAVLLGQRQDLSAELLTHYRQAGIVHILVVSGLHIGVVYLIFSFLCKSLHRFPWGRTVSVSLVVLLLWSYALLTGLSVPVVRAVTMFSLVALARILH